MTPYSKTLPNARASTQEWCQKALVYMNEINGKAEVNGTDLHPLTFF